jgi:hypothetical protein
MNQYLLLRRMFWPIMLLVFGVTAILNEYTGIGYDKSWPLYLIAWGVLKLAENAVLAQNPPPPPAPYPGSYPGSYPGYPPAPGPGSGPGYGPPPAPPAGPTTTAIVPSDGEERR